MCFNTQRDASLVKPFRTMKRLGSSLSGCDFGRVITVEDVTETCLLAGFGDDEDGGTYRDSCGDVGGGSGEPSHKGGWEVSEVLSASPTEFKIWRVACMAWFVATGNPFLLPQVLTMIMVVYCTVEQPFLTYILTYTFAGRPDAEPSTG